MVEEIISEVGNQLCYESAKAVTTHPAMLVFLSICILVPFILYIVAGLTIKGRSPNGRVASNPMIYSLNYWWAFVIWGFIQTGLLILYIFPVWLKIFC